MKEIIYIKEKEDYDVFYEKYMDNNQLKYEYKHRMFLFVIKFNSPDNIDERLLFEYYLIANKCDDGQYELEIRLDSTRDEAVNIYHFLSSYCFIEQNVYGFGGTVKYKDGVRQKLQIKNLSGVKRLVPIFRIDKSTVNFFKHPVDEQTWEKIFHGNSYQLNTFENIIYRLCWRLMFAGVGDGNTALTELRTRAFSTDSFKSIISGIPTIALVVFAMMDYAFREEAVERYKDRIREINKSVKKIRLTENDFLGEKQDEQQLAHFKAYKYVKENYCDNKTIMESKDKIHNYIVNELYDAITISEGIIQLFENIVNHAGREGDGIGLAEIFIRSYDRDKKLLNHKYPDYMTRILPNSERSKYFLELVISDLSGTNIPDKFYENNKKFFCENEAELKKRILQLGGQNMLPSRVTLGSFFTPVGDEKKFWQAFFSFPDRAVNHYGLQIFDSVITSKNGLFEVRSGGWFYDNFNNQDSIKSVRGSRYNILCPLNGINANNNNIYDSMFSYNYTEDIGKNKIKNIKHIPDGKVPLTSQEVEEYVKNVYNEVKNVYNSEQIIINIDVSTYSSIECLVKGVILYVFNQKEKEPQGKILLAFQNCTTCQIINIVRILSIFYGKQGENIKMQNVQIYIRGKEVGEEVLFYGKELREVRNNISKSACMRGTMFENFQTINKILSKADNKGGCYGK